MGGLWNTSTTQGVTAGGRMPLPGRWTGARRRRAHVRSAGPVDVGSRGSARRGRPLRRRWPCFWGRWGSGCGLSPLRGAAPYFDANATEGNIYRLYRAYFLQEPDVSGFSYWYLDAVL